MKILVTGGLGFIGSTLCESLLKEGHSIVVVDNLSSQIHGNIPNINLDWLNHNNVAFHRIDIRDASAMEKIYPEVDVIVHLAAETGTGQSMYQISHYYAVNQQATAAMFEAVGTKFKNIKKIILASSRSIYGECAYLCKGSLITASPRNKLRMDQGNFEPVGSNGEQLELIATPETAIPQPASVYAATKLANEVLGRIFSESFGIPVIALRFQNVYGERQSLKNPYTGILSIFSNRMRENLPINIFEDGLESRDFVHVSDVVNAINLSLVKDIVGYHAINIGSGTPTSVMEVAETLRSILDSSSELSISGDYRAGDIRHCYADLQVASELLGYSPKVSLKNGLKKFCDWVTTQEIQTDNSEKVMNELVALGLGKA